MKADSARVILGFYSSEHVDAEKAYLAIGGSAGRKVRLFSGNGTGNGTKRHGAAEARYSALRLEGESLVLAETPLPKVQAVVKKLQRVGLPAVFVLGARPSKAAGRHRKSVLAWHGSFRPRHC